MANQTGITEAEEFEFRRRAEEEAGSVMPQQGVIPASPERVPTISPADVAAVGVGAGALGKKAVSSLTKPIREVKPIDAQLQAIAQKQFPNTNVSTSDLPTLMQEKLNVFKKSNAVPSFDFENKVLDTSVQEIARQKGLFTQKTINPTLDSVAKHIVENYKPSIENAYNQYRTGMSKVEDIISKSGNQLQTEDVHSFLNSAIAKAEQAGATEAQLVKLNKIADAFSGTDSGLLDALGNKIDVSKPVPFSQVKGNVAYLLNNLDDNAKHVVANEWGTYMGRFVPQTAQAVYSDLQDRYSKFAPLRNTLFNLLGKEKTGYNTLNMTRRLRSLVKGGEDAGITQLISALSDGTDMVAPVKGLKDKVSVLSELTKEYNDFDAQSIKIKSQKAVNAGIIKQAKQLIADAEKNYADLQLQTKTLLSQKAGVMEKYPVRTFLWDKAPKMAMRMLSGAGRVLPVALPALAIAGAIADPAEAATSPFMGGTTELGNDAETFAEMERAAKAVKPSQYAGKQAWEKYYKETRGGMLK